MTVGAWLKRAEEQLQRSDILTARLDALVLLEDCTNKDRAWLLAHHDTELSAAQQITLQTQLERRKTHEPLAYIRQKSEFYGREFYIDHRVLEPRPESEAIIDLLKRQPLGANPVIADVGTGSGMLAITAKLELPAAKVIAIDIDPDCLKVARRNAQNLEADITFLQGDLLTPLKTTAGNLVLLCNLPYVPDSFQINPAAMNEPRVAIFGGLDGLDVYRALFKQVHELNVKPTLIFTEALPPQHDMLATIAAEGRYQQIQDEDFIQLFSLPGGVGVAEHA